VSELIQTCRELHSDLEQLAKSPLLVMNRNGRSVINRTQVLLVELEDLADRVTLLEIAQASSTEKIPT
jgi:hypothetical protein